MAKLVVFENSKEIASLKLEKDKEYSVGRSAENDLSLPVENLSRQHFKILFENQKWVVRLVARYGEIIYQNLPQKNFELKEVDSFAIPPFMFKFYEKPEESKNADASLTGVPTKPLYNDDATEDLASFDEKTTPGWSLGIPYLSISSPDGYKDSLRLEGDYWLIGRDPKNEIYIEDSRSSRTHAEIVKNGGVFTLKDLNSSNGMLFNGTKMTPNLPIPLMSGDEFKIGATSFYFEIRDPNFDDKIKNLPADIVNYNSQAYSPPPLFKSGSGGAAAVRVDVQPFYKRPVVIGIATVTLLILVFGTGNDDKKKQSKTSLSSKSSGTPKMNLTSDQKEFVERTYKLAKTLYMQNKYSMALAEIEKVHEYVDSYEDSRQIEQLSKEGMDAENQLRQIAVDEQKQKETHDRIQSIVMDCEAQFYNLKLSPDAVRSCLQEASDLDPGNAEAEGLIAKAEDFQRQKELQLQNKVAYNQRIQSGRNQYTQAKRLYESGKLKEARDAYNRFITSANPDPDGLKAKAKTDLESVKQELVAKLASYKSEAESFKSQDKFKEAILSLRKAKEIDPSDGNIKDLEHQYTAELRKNMMTLYSESVIEENLGNIESAKEKWLKIRQLDVSNGEYFNKAKIKLKKYGL